MWLVALVSVVRDAAGTAECAGFAKTVVGHLEVRRKPAVECSEQSDARAVAVAFVKTVAEIVELKLAVHQRTASLSGQSTLVVGQI